MDRSSNSSSVRGGYESLSVEQKQAVDAFKKGKNLFITGPGGSGKSHLIRYIRALSAADGRRCSVTALTGCAAVLLECRAKTLHSWAGIGLGDGEVNDLVKKIKKGRAGYRWKRTDVLIIDEVSMMSYMMMDKLNQIAKAIRGNPSPFGGIQLILLGDFCQLPPVSSGSTPVFAFMGESWKECVEECIYLKTIQRQKDHEFQEVLNHIRMGECNEKVLEFVQRRMDDSKTVVDKDGGDAKIRPTRVYPTNINVESVNDKELAKISGEPIKYECKSSYTFRPKGRGSGDSDEDETDKPATAEQIARELEVMAKNCGYQKSLNLKVGSQVILLVNLDFDRQLVNGSRGVVIGFEGGYPMVDFGKTREVIGPKAWESSEILGLVVNQIPLKLAWALTIHKTQGLTIDALEIDIGSSLFEYGQSYVAMSRVRSADGLYIKDFDPRRIKVHPKVKEFYEDLLSDSE